MISTRVTIRTPGRDNTPVLSIQVHHHVAVAFRQMEGLDQGRLNRSDELLLPSLCPTTSGDSNTGDIGFLLSDARCPRIHPHQKPPCHGEVVWRHSNVLHRGAEITQTPRQLARLPNRSRAGHTLQHGGDP